MRTLQKQNFLRQYANYRFHFEYVAPPNLVFINETTRRQNFKYYISKPNN
jgi:hypothetical protein